MLPLAGGKAHGGEIQSISTHFQVLKAPGAGQNTPGIEIIIYSRYLLKQKYLLAKVKLQ